MKKISTLCAIVLLIFLFNACGVGDIVDVVQTVDCQKKIDDYNNSLDDFRDFLKQVLDDNDSFTCEEFVKRWNDISSDFDNLCDETKDADGRRKFEEVKEGTKELDELLGCEIDFGS